MWTLLLRSWLVAEVMLALLGAFSNRFAVLPWVWVGLSLTLLVLCWNIVANLKSKKMPVDSPP